MEEKIDLEVMYFHGKTTEGYKFTIAGVIEDPYLNMGIAVCSKRDNFVKVKGRRIAEERLLSQRNSKLVGRSQVHLYNDPDDPVEHEKYYFVNNEFKTFVDIAAKCQNLSKKNLLKLFNLRINQ